MSDPLAGYVAPLCTLCGIEEQSARCSWVYRHKDVTLAEVQAEAAKCEVRCPNCHRLRHYREGFGAYSGNVRR